MEFLQKLQISTHNEGISTGSKWLAGHGVVINSYSPVDGALIAAVSTANKEDYDQVVTKSPRSF